MAKNMEVQDQNAQSDSFIKKIFKNITIEPMFLCYFFPFYFGGVFIENMNFEISCRNNINQFTNFSKDICQLVVRKEAYGITCGSDTITNITEDALNMISVKHSNIFELVRDNLTNVVQAICDVENVVQVHLADINAIRIPISTFGPLIIILFAAGWSDKKGRRVPCMILPFLGEAFGFLTLFISALFMNDIPVEIPTYLYKIVPSVTGADSLMTIAAFSYLGAISTDENRFFRFGLFQIIITLIPVAGQICSPLLFDNFGYAEYFGWCMPIYVVGFFYIIYFIKEVKVPVSEKEGIDNAACDIDSTDRIENQNPSKLEEKKNCCAEFFDPELPINCIKVFLKERVSPIRIVLILIVICHFLNVGLTQGEIINLFFIMRKKLNADATFLSHFSAYVTILAILGMFVMMGLNKILKIKDIVMLLMINCATIISKMIYAQSTDKLGYYIAAAVDFCGGSKYTVSKSFVSKLIPASDLSSMYAMMGIVEQVTGLLVPSAYSTFYSKLVEDNHDVGFLFYLSSAVLLLSFVMYLIIFKLLRSHKIEDTADMEQENIDVDKVTTNNIELTKL
ncbi:unnamed protein product [Diamesa tonsa]